MRTVALLDAVEDVSRGNIKIPQSEFQDSGALPVVDQGQSLIAGYTDETSAAVSAGPAVIVFGDHTRALKFVDFPFAMGADGVKILRVRGGFEPRYVFHALRSQPIPSAGYSRHFKFLKELRVPQPPLDEQRRIAAILDHADALRAKRRQVLAHLDALPQAIFHEMFGHMAAHREIGEFANVQTGATPPRDDPTNFNGGIPWIKTGEVTGIITATAETVSEQGAKKARLRRFPIGSVVIAMYGQGATRGRSALLAIEATTNQACAVIEPNESFEPVFLLTQLRIGYEQLRESAEGGNQPNLNLARIRSFKVRLPARETQRAFVQRVENVSRSMAVTAQSMVADDELFASLQSRAFRGEL